MSNKWLRNLTTVVVVASTWIVAAAGANAGILFNWSYTDTATGGTIVSAAGTLDAVSTGNPGQYIIDQLSGLRNGQAITFFAPSLTYPNIATFSDGSTADNLLYYPAGSGPGTGQLNIGIILSTVDGDFNIYFNNAGAFGPIAGDYEYTIHSGVIPGTAVNFTANPVPEPGAIALVATTLFLMFGFSMTRRRAVA